MGRPPSDIQERLLASALRRFADRGVDGASLRTIASDAGTSVGMIAYHFGSKEGLFDALVSRHYAPMVERIRTVAETEEEPVDRLFAVLEAFGAAVAEHPDVASLLFREATGRSERIQRLMPLFLEGHMAILLQTIVDAQASGRMRELSLQPLLAVLLSPYLLPRLLGADALMGMEQGALEETATAVLRAGLVTS